MKGALHNRDFVNNKRDIVKRSCLHKRDFVKRAAFTRFCGGSCLHKRDFVKRAAFTNRGFVTGAVLTKGIL